MGTPPAAAMTAVDPVAVLIQMPLDHTLKLKISSPFSFTKPMRNLSTRNQGERGQVRWIGFVDVGNGIYVYFLYNIYCIIYIQSARARTWRPRRGWGATPECR